MLLLVVVVHGPLSVLKLSVVVAGIEHDVARLTLDSVESLSGTVVASDDMGVNHGVPLLLKVEFPTAKEARTKGENVDHVSSVLTINMH